MRAISYPVVDAGQLTWVTVQQMREIDRKAVDLGLGLPEMMENAGRCLARVVTELLAGVKRRRVTTLVGMGGNGGGAAVAARHLANRGARVLVQLPTEVTLKAVTASRSSSHGCRRRDPDRGQTTGRCGCGRAPRLQPAR